MTKDRCHWDTQGAGLTTTFWVSMAISRVVAIFSSACLGAGVRNVQLGLATALFPIAFVLRRSTELTQVELQICLALIGLVISLNNFF